MRSNIFNQRLRLIELRWWKFIISGWNQNPTFFRDVLLDATSLGVKYFDVVESYYYSSPPSREDRSSSHRSVSWASLVGNWAYVQQIELDTRYWYMRLWNMFCHGVFLFLLFCHFIILGFPFLLLSYFDQVFLFRCVGASVLAKPLG